MKDRILLVLPTGAGTVAYCSSLARILRQWGHDVQELRPASARRSVFRYAWHFLLLPALLAWRVVREKPRYVLLGDEWLLHLLLVTWLLGWKEKVIPIMHHVPRRFGTEGQLQRCKDGLVVLMARLLPLSCQILTPSSTSRREIADLVPAVKSAIRVVPNVVERGQSDTHEPCGAVGRTWDFLGRSVVLYVGSDEARKNLRTIEVASQAPELKEVIFVHVGQQLHAGARPEYPNWLRLGLVSNAELDSLYLAADLFVAPSLHEGFGRTPVEAQLHGLPVIASDLPINHEVLGSSFVPVKRPEDSSEWASAIAALLGDTGSRSLLREAGVQNAGRFSCEVVGQQLLRVLSSA